MNLSKILFLSLLTLLSGCLSTDNNDNSSKIDGSLGGFEEQTDNDEEKVLFPPQILIAQTHLIPPAGLQWPETKIDPKLLISGNRETLVTVKFKEDDLIEPRLQVWDNTSIVGSFALLPPEQLINTEGNDTPPTKGMWHTFIPANLVGTGLSLSLKSKNYNESANQWITVGPETEVTFNILPVFLFGATEANTGKNFNDERILSLNADLMQEAAAGLPFSHVIFKNHPAKDFKSDFLVIPPRKGKPAFVAYSTSDVEDTGVIDTVNGIISTIHTPSGDQNLNKVTYGSILALDNSKQSDNKLAWISRGVSYTGSGTATSGNGGLKYGFLWHEGGHSLSLGHSSGEYESNYFPYIGGSIKGSSWGYNNHLKQFRSTLIPPTSEIFNSCRTNDAYQKDSNGQCYRQDPMDNGDGGSAPEHNFPLFSDYNSARMQSWATNRIKIDSTSPTQFSSWDSTSKAWTSYTPTKKSYGAWAVKENLPVIFNEPTAKINVTFSKAGTKDVSRFYPVMYAIENSITAFDPINQTHLNSIYPRSRADGSNPEYMWYCHISGCDYTVRVTFSDETTKYQLLKNGFRKKSYPEEFDEGVDDPLNEKSFKFWSINVPRPNNTTVKKLELLETPKVWNMSQDQIRNANVLISKEY